MIAEITKIFKFEAAHNLPYHQGKCRNMHGHSYRAEVTLVGTVQEIDAFNSESGMVVDFSAMSNYWKTHLEPLLDHSEKGTLNDVITLGDRVIYPTAEWIAGFILKKFAEWIIDTYSHSDVFVSSVRVWETETSYATVRV